MASALKQRREELTAAISEIDSVLTRITSDDPEWIDRLQPIVHAEVAQLENSLANVRKDPVGQWDDLDAIGGRLARLATETLAFVGGIAARSADLDAGLCDLADRLLQDVAGPMLQNYHPITLPASSEFIDVLSEVIRVRYPGAGIWDLPVVLHEFGHFVMSRIGLPDVPVVAIVKQQRGQRPALGYHAEELWADTFATYVGGPAYAFACITRFSPASLHAEAGTHPSPVKRVAAVMRTLAALERAWQKSGALSGSLKEATALAAGLWQSRLDATGSAAPKPEDEAYAAELAEQYVDILDANNVIVRFDDTTRAGEVRRALDALAEAPPDGCSLVDVLNGAWWARRAAELDDKRAPDVAKVTHAACRMCGSMR